MSMMKRVAELRPVIEGLIGLVVEQRDDEAQTEAFGAPSECMALSNKGRWKRAKELMEREGVCPDEVFTAVEILPEDELRSMYDGAMARTYLATLAELEPDGDLGDWGGADVPEQPESVSYGVQMRWMIEDAVTPPMSGW